MGLIRGSGPGGRTGNTGKPGGQLGNKNASKGKSGQPTQPRSYPRLKRFGRAAATAAFRHVTGIRPQRTYGLFR